MDFPVTSLLPALPDLAAQLAVQSAAPPPGGGASNMIVMLGGMALIVYFVAIRPERKERARKEEMLGAIKKNDKVLLTSGMYATVAAVNESDLTVKFDDGNTRVRILKSAIATTVDGADAAAS